jgi:hypothetical protein
MQLDARPIVLGPARRALVNARVPASSGSRAGRAAADLLLRAPPSGHRRAAGGDARVLARALATAGVMGVDGLQGAAYRVELAAACDAVRLASKLCEMVQRQLADAEKVEKSDSSPVTVADYGAPLCDAHRDKPGWPVAAPFDAAMGQAMIPATTLLACHLRADPRRVPSRRMPDPSSTLLAGAQALVAWALSRAFPGTTVSMVGEEDSADLRAPGGKAMLQRITQLVNTVLAGVDGGAQITEQQLVDLIGARLRPCLRQLPAWPHAASGSSGAGSSDWLKLPCPPPPVQIWASPRAAAAGGTGCWTPSTAPAASSPSGSAQQRWHTLPRYALPYCHYDPVLRAAPLTLQLPLPAPAACRRLWTVPALQCCCCRRRGCTRPLPWRH